MAAARARRQRLDTLAWILWVTACENPVMTSAEMAQAVAPSSPTSPQLEPSGNPGPPPTGGGPSAPEAAFRVVGRPTFPDPKNANCVLSSWPGTRIGVRVDGTVLAMVLSDTNNQPVADPAGGFGALANLWDVSVDGNLLAAPISGCRAPGEMTVVDGLPARRAGDLAVAAD